MYTITACDYHVLIMLLMFLGILQKTETILCCVQAVIHQSPSGKLLPTAAFLLIIVLLIRFQLLLINFKLVIGMSDSYACYSHLVHYYSISAV